MQDEIRDWSRPILRNLYQILSDYSVSACGASKCEIQCNAAGKCIMQAVCYVEVMIAMRESPSSSRTCHNQYTIVAMIFL